MTAANEKPDCPHKHTGSCSPDGVYLYVRCMDCWEILMMSDEGRRRLSECQGYEPPKKEFGRHCIHCDFDFWDHKRRAQPAEKVDEADPYASKDHEVATAAWEAKEREAFEEWCAKENTVPRFKESYWKIWLARARGGK